MGSQKIKPMAEGGILSAIAVAMALISIYVPLIGTMVAFIWPLPIIILVVRHGIRWGIMASIVSCLLIAMLIHPMQALMMLIAFGLVGLVLGYNYRKGYGAFKSLGIGIIASILAKIAVIALSAVLLNINPFQMQMEAVDEGFKTSIEIYRTAGMSEEQLATLETDIKHGMEVVKLLFPMIIVFAGIIDAFINFSVAGKVLRKLGNTDVVSLKPFSEWRMPIVVVYLYAFALIGMYWGSTREIELLFQISLNANVFATALGFIQGLTIFTTVANRYNLSKFLRGIILILVFTTGLFLQVLAFIGLFDIVFDYRRRLGWHKE